MNPSTLRSQNSFSSGALLLLILAIGVTLRVAQFPHLPPGFNQDEAASAYEAYSLSETGLDKWGNAWPAYFPGWGSGQNVLLAYLTIPAIKVFGLNIYSARLVSLLTGLLTLPLFYFTLRPIGRFGALLGTLMLAIVPWHFMLARWGLESNLLPFFMLLGCTLLSRAFITQQRRWIIPSLLPFALSLYAYGTTIVVIPVLLGLVLVIGFKQLLAHRGSWLVALALFLVAATPFLLFFAENYILGHNLAWTDSLAFSTPMLPSTRMSQVATTEWTNTIWHNCRFLFSSFNDGSSYNRMPGFKPLLYPTLPLAIAGLALAAHKIRSKRAAFFATPRTVVLATFGLWGLCSLPLFLAFELNINRFNHFYLPCIVLAAWAVEAISNRMRSGSARNAIRIGIIGWLAVEGGLAAHRYFTTYADGEIKADFNAGLGEAFAAVQQLKGLNQVRITDKIPLPYAYTLFYLRYPPSQFQQEVKFSISEGSYSVHRFGKYIFSDSELHRNQAWGYLLRKTELPGNAAHQRKVLFTNQVWEVGVMPPDTTQPLAKSVNLEHSLN